MDTNNGDNHLSSFDQQLWSLHHQVLLQFQCYTMFKFDFWDVPNKKRALIQWFVPRDHSQCFEVVKWLEYELAPEQTDDTDTNGFYFPGTDVSVAVMEFKGVDGYVDRDIAERLAEEMMQRFKNEKTRHNQRPDDG